MIKLLALLLGSALLPHLASAGTITCPPGAASNCAISIQGVPVAAAMPTDGQGLVYSAAAGAWLPLPGNGSGTVTSVGLSAPSWLTVGGSPVTTTGTLALTGTSEAANLFLASPNGSSGALTPRAIVSADFEPSLAAAVSTLCSASTTNFVRGDGTCVAPSGGGLDSDWSFVTHNFIGNFNGGSVSFPTSQLTNGIYVAGSNALSAGYGATAWQNGNPNSTGQFLSFTSGGTNASPVGVTSGAGIGNFAAYAFNGSAFPASANAGIFFLATQNQTTAAEGANMVLCTTPNGSTVSSSACDKIDQNQAVLIPSTAANPGANGLAVTGPAVLSGTLTTDITGSTQCVHANSSGVLSGTGSDCSSGGGSGTPVVFTGVTATSANAQTMASPTPSGFTFTNQFIVQFLVGSGLTNTGATTLSVNSTTAEPVEVQSGTSFSALTGGELQAGFQYTAVVNTTCTCYVLTSIIGTPVINNATSTTITAAQFARGAIFNVTSGGQTFTLPVATSLSPGGSITINAVGVSATIQPNAADGINGGSVGSSVTVSSGVQASVFTVGSSGTGAFTANPLTGGGGTTTVTLSPQLTSSPTTYNAGAQTITNGSTLSPQVFYKAETSSCTLNSTCNSPSTNDSGLLPTPTASGLTITTPAPGAVGTNTYQIGYDGTDVYSITTPSGSIYGCGSGSGATVSGVASRVVLTSDGTNWQCNAWSSIVGLSVGTIPVAMNSGKLGNSSIVDSGTVTIGDAIQNFSTTTETMTISTATFTPNLAAGINHFALLVHASCPCTIANPLNISLHVGETGFIDIQQSSAGGDTVTFGSQYVTPGGTSSLTLSTGANDIDSIAYRVRDGSTVVLGPVQANATH